MLPFVLGGVALAATGYGVKKFFEDDENRDKLEDTLIRGYDWMFNSDSGDFSSFLNIWSDPYILFCLRKNKIKELLKDAFELLQEIHHNELLSHLNKIQNFHFDKIPDIEMFEDELKIKMREFCQVLLDKSTYHIQILDELDALVLKENDYTKYTDDKKEKVYQLTMLTIMLYQAVSLLSQFNDDSPNRTIIRAFERLKGFSEKEMSVLQPET